MKIFTLLFAVILSAQLEAQNNIDSIVIKYLRTQPNIPSPRIIKEKQGNQIIVSKNYFLKNNSSITQGRYRISTYLFGSSIEDADARKYLLILIKDGAKEDYKIIDDEDIENAIAHLLAYVKPCALPNRKKALLINKLTIAYY